MKSHVAARFLPAILFLITFAYLTSAVPPASALDYVRVISTGVNIREAPDKQSVSVSKGTTGDIFELIREDGEWFSIEMFSGIPRFVHTSQAEKFDFKMDLTITPDEHTSIVALLKGVRARARKEADTTFPMKKGDDVGSSEQFDRNSKLLNELLDRYLLEALRKKNLQPPLYWYFVVEDEIGESEKTPIAR